MSENEQAGNKRRPYRKFTTQQKTELVVASLRGHKTVAQLCCENEISERCCGVGVSRSSPPARSA